MTLELPADIEPFTTAFHTPAVYALRLDLPRDLPQAWDAVYDHRPDYVDLATERDRVIYVGATGDILSRLEDHRDGEVRQAALVSLAEDKDLRNVWPFDDETRAFERENQFAIMLRQQYADAYVHSR
jgi:predicted GIY-YIG superfamily endonuclease